MLHIVVLYSSILSLLVLSVGAGKEANTSCGSKLGGPTDNPVATLYNEGTYGWADAMVNWSCVYNVKDYDNSFEKAQKAAINDNGGGVIYFPKGTYSFTANILIESNVIIRGEPTSELAKNGKSAGKLTPQTIFKCTFGEHIGIYNNDPKAKNIGIVNVELDGCAVMFWPGLKTISKYTLKSYWYQATDVVGMGMNKLVLGNKIHDVTYKHPNPDDPNGNIWPWSFSTAIASYSDNNTLVANNLISKSVTTMKTTVTFSDDKMTIPYPVDNRYGIDVNQVLLGGVIGAYNEKQCPSSPGKLSPSCAPWYFRRGLTIRDNYVYMNGRVGVSWSGGGDGKTIGSGTQLYNNHVEVAAGTTCWSVTGTRLAKGSDTNENRGYNQQGYESNLTMNSGHINRQKIPSTSYLTVDGEGILHQASNGNDGLRNLWYKNDLSGGSTGYLVYYKLYNVEYNQLISNTAAEGFSIGVIIDTDHHNVQHNVCKDNHPKCTGI
jgi:hypothetical protein